MCMISTCYLLPIVCPGIIHEAAFALVFLSLFQKSESIGYCCCYIRSGLRRKMVRKLGFWLGIVAVWNSGDAALRSWKRAARSLHTVFASHASKNFGSNVASSDKHHKGVWYSSCTWTGDTLCRLNSVFPPVPNRTEDLFHLVSGGLVLKEPSNQRHGYSGLHLKIICIVAFLIRFKRIQCLYGMVLFLFVVCSVVVGNTCLLQWLRSVRRGFVRWKCTNTLTFCEKLSQHIKLVWKLLSHLVQVSTLKEIKQDGCC